MLNLPIIRNVKLEQNKNVIVNDSIFTVKIGLMMSIRKL